MRQGVGSSCGVIPSSHPPVLVLFLKLMEHTACWVSGIPAEGLDGILCVRCGGCYFYHLKNGQSSRYHDVTSFLLSRSRGELGRLDFAHLGSPELFYDSIVSYRTVTLQGDINSKKAHLKPNIVYYFLHWEMGPSNKTHKGALHLSNIFLLLQLPGVSHGLEYSKCRIPEITRS